MTSFWNKITALVRGVARESTQPKVTISPKEAAMAKIAAGASMMTQEEEYDCEAVYALMDEYTELVARGEDVSQLMPKVDHHIKMCSGCCEEYKMLRDIISAQSA